MGRSSDLPSWMAILFLRFSFLTFEYKYSILLVGITVVIRTMPVSIFAKAIVGCSIVILMRHIPYFLDNLYGFLHWYNPSNLLHIVEIVLLLVVDIDFARP